MNTLYNQAIAATFERKTENATLSGKFLAWCKKQEQNRLLWLGIALAGHGCVITPLTFLVVVMTGLNFILLTITMFAMVAVLIVNLAALPAKLTIPVFFSSLIADLAIIAVAFML